MTSKVDGLIAAVRAGDLVQVRAILKEHRELASARSSEGASPLHYAAEAGHRAIVDALLEAGADINARDAVFDATPAGWAIEYLRQRGGLLAMEIDETLRAVAKGDAELVRWYVTRLPALKDAVGKDGAPVRVRAKQSDNAEVRRLFGG